MSQTIDHSVAADPVGDLAPLEIREVMLDNLNVSGQITAGKGPVFRLDHAA